MFLAYEPTSKNHATFPCPACALRKAMADRADLEAELLARRRRSDAALAIVMKERDDSHIEFHAMKAERDYAYKERAAAVESVEGFRTSLAVAVRHKDNAVEGFEKARAEADEAQAKLGKELAYCVREHCGIQNCKHYAAADELRAVVKKTIRHLRARDYSQLDGCIRDLEEAIAPPRLSAAVPALDGCPICGAHCADDCGWDRRHHRAVSRGPAS